MPRTQKMNISAILSSSLASLIFLSVSLTALTAKAGQLPVNHPLRLKKKVKEISKSDLMGILRDFSSSSGPNRVVGSSGHLKARAYLEAALKELASAPGASFKVQSFDPDISAGIAHLERSEKNSLASLIQGAKARKDVEGKNLIIDFKGASEETLVIAAHYDGLAFDENGAPSHEALSAGADYNASGVGAALGIARLLSGLKLKRGVRIVFLDWQAFGSLGSMRFAEKAKKGMKDKGESLVGAINLFMLGHDSKRFDTDKKYGNMKVYLRSEARDSSGDDVELLSAFTRMSEKLAKGKPDFRPDRNDFAKSDSYRFWEAGIPSVTFTQNWETDKNRAVRGPNDFPESLNQKTLFQAFQYLAYGVIGWANEIP